MKNSKKKEKANAIIKDVLELIDEEYLQRLIDEPVQEIFSGFDFDRNARFSNEYFLNVIAGFIQKLYLKGPGIRQDLSHPGACAEALSIIEKVYRNQDSPAYDAAIVDGIHDISNVLARITEFIINRLRKIHMQWVYQSRIDPLDWPARCLIAKILTNQWAPYLPPMIRSCEPAHLADAIPHLLKLISSNHIIINKRMATGIDFF